jgi:hypothetical protein
MRQPIIALLVLWLIAFGAQSAYAVPVRWTIGSYFLDGVAVISDGGRVVGGFTYDADSGVYSDFTLRTYSTGYAGANYSIYVPTLDPTTSLTAFQSTTGGLLGQRALYLGFGPTLTNAGGQVALILVNEGVCAEISPLTGGVCLLTQDHLSQGAGFLTGAAIIPIPAAAWLFGSALGLIGFARRRTA